ncbi:SDR family NAD(P)-dependent oxidoreductase [Legionella sp. W05-934-2]|jgi:NAD(P)-dependent dehydrogenase (short-subunit alcohol dehydrogenase family)|uniref:SDR family NAD(P)-dependent oxidoreductase n=1 Tax=Legionella sp. W05-934-2 TaxID=1198649 RepID=UPI0034618F43
MERIIVIGDGGIGQSFAHFCEESGKNTFLLGRNYSIGEIPKSLNLNLDNSTSFQQIAEFVASNKIDTLVNTLGILHHDNHFPEKTISQLEPDWLFENLKINCFSSLLILKYLNQYLPAASQFKFVALSARVGSIADNHLGGWISYRVSKAALNMGLKTAAIEWKHKFRNAVIAAYHPGTVDTKLSKPFQANIKSIFTPQQASAYLYDFIDHLHPAMSGGFYAWNKERIPY